ncbi:formate dehydrogenase subunit gamma [Chelatococcus sambhunathii]|uniref:Formate dehydrogenase subunit gamma n=1 Tax=Chelatococcus sambhunathii TaxID=363953 RepID=A0ABU1DEN1_9HYPH|nr:formate dehydrogenase subunit gamma [Chelatococcus sambhunathii]MDR4306547.1 formate dehydrogenase subunit gamma [Chelatococcus sambhunathii]
MSSGYAVIGEARGRHEAWSPARGSEIIADHLAMEGATLPILHAMQETFGYVPQDAVPLIADALNLSRAEVHGSMTFYHDFRNEPAGKHIVKVCVAEACQAAGGNATSERIAKALDCAFGETRPDGQVTLEPIYCLGLCSCAPSAMVNGRLVGRLDDEAVDEIAAECRS